MVEMIAVAPPCHGGGRGFESRLSRHFRQRNQSSKNPGSAIQLFGLADQPQDNREVLVCLARTGPVAHDAMVAGASECNQRLLEELGKEEVAALPGPVDRLTDTAAGTLGAEKDLNRPEVRRSEFSRAGPPGLSK